MAWEAAPEALTSALVNANDLNSIASAAFSPLGAEIDNEAGLYEFMAVQLALGSFTPTTTTGGPRVNLYLVTLVGASYEDSGSVFQANQVVYAFGMSTTTSAKLMNARMILIPPLKFKLRLENGTGAGFPSSGNSLNFRRYS